MEGANGDANQHVFSDRDTIIRKVQKDLKTEFENEKEFVLSSLSERYKSKFREVGFCRKKPVQILSPYDVLPGKVRTQWLKAFDHAKSVKGSLPYVLFWFSSSSKYFDDSSVSVEAASDFVNYKDGEAQGLTSIPLEIQQHLLRNCLTEEDNRKLEEMSKAVKAAETGKLHLPVLADYQCFSCTFTTSSTASTSASTGTSKRMPKLNDKISVYWKRDKAFYSGYVDDIRADFFHVNYDDGDSDWLPLAEEKWVFASNPKAEEEEDEEDVDMGNTLNSGTKDDGKPASLKIRTNDDGTISPVSPPKLDSDGRFIRPKGRSPKNFEWNYRLGVWEPQGSSSLGKRTSSGADSNMNPQKRVKNTQCPPKRLSESSVTLSEKEAEAKHSFENSATPSEKEAEAPTPDGDTSSPQSGSQSTPSLDCNSIDDLLLELTQCLGGIEGGKFRVQSASNDNILRAEAIMDSIATMAFQFSFFENVLKPIRKLQSHPRLGVRAEKLYKRIFFTYDVKLIRNWRQATEENNLEEVEKSVATLWKRLDPKSYPCSLAEVASEIGDLQDLIECTGRLFQKNNVDPQKVEILASKMVFLNAKDEVWT